MGKTSERQRKWCGGRRGGFTEPGCLQESSHRIVKICANLKGHIYMPHSHGSTVPSKFVGGGKKKKKAKTEEVRRDEHHEALKC